MCVRVRVSVSVRVLVRVRVVMFNSILKSIIHTHTHACTRTHTYRGHIEIAEWFLDQPGVIVNWKSESGYTPLSSLVSLSLFLFLSPFLSLSLFLSPSLSLFLYSLFLSE